MSKGKGQEISLGEITFAVQQDGRCGHCSLDMAPRSAAHTGAHNTVRSRNKLSPRPR
jgi:hypothetical protein